MRIMSWNVNGIRAVQKKGFLDFVRRENPDILCIQETKAHKDQLTPELVSIPGYQSYWSSAQRKGYSGVATYTKVEPLNVSYGIDHGPYDSEGRFVVTTFKDFSLYNVYFPNGSSGPERHAFKQQFLHHFKDWLHEKIKKGEQLIVLGDYNVAHKDIDVYDPIKLSVESGFLPEEREWFQKFLDIGFIDTFRYLHPNDRDRYTWWSYREMARIGNRGWRIDMICVTEGLKDRVQAAEILDQVEGSDHCPITLELKD